MIEGEETEWVEKVKEEQGKDKELRRIREELQKDGERGKEWSMWDINEEGVVFNEGRMVVPKSLQTEIVHRFHSNAITGHPGKWKTYDLVRRQYWWPNMAKTVEAYVRKCDECQRTKGP